MVTQIPETVRDIERDQLSQICGCEVRGAECGVRSASLECRVCSAQCRERGRRDRHAPSTSNRADRACNHELYTTRRTCTTSRRRPEHSPNRLRPQFPARSCAHTTLVEDRSDFAQALAALVQSTGDSNHRHLCRMVEEADAIAAQPLSPWDASYTLALRLLRLERRGGPGADEGSFKLREQVDDPGEELPLSTRSVADSIGTAHPCPGSLDEPLDQTAEHDIAGQPIPFRHDHHSGAMSGERGNGGEETRAVVEIGSATNAAIYELGHDLDPIGSRPGGDGGPLRCGTQLLAIRAYPEIRHGSGWICWDLACAATGVCE